MPSRASAACRIATAERSDASLSSVPARSMAQSLVARELKARYRGSVLGFFWSFFNPLLLLVVYTFVFTYVMPPPEGQTWADVLEQQLG